MPCRVKSLFNACLLAYSCLCFFALAPHICIAQSVELPHQSASLEGSVESHYLGAGTSTILTFYNVFADPVNVYWLNYQGNRVFVASLQTGQVQSELTYFTHPFLITDANGAGLFIVIPEGQSPSPYTWRATAYPTTINVTLPAVDIPLDTNDKYIADPLPLTFTENFPGSPYILAGAVSNEGTLEGTLGIYGFTSIDFTSTTTATVSVLFPGAFFTLPVRHVSEGIITTSCLLNGPYNGNHYYFQWQSPGFDSMVTDFGISEIPLYGRIFPDTPLEYWVDLDNLTPPLSPVNTSLDAIIQGAESYIHTELTEYYVFPQITGAIPIPSSDVTIKPAKTTYDSQTHITTQVIYVLNKSNATFEGPIQLLLTGLSENFIESITPEPSFYMSTDPYFTCGIGTFAPGNIATFTLKYDGVPQSLTYTGYAYSGSFKEYLAF